VDFALRLPTATRGTIAAGSRRASRFSRMALPRMLGVCRRPRQAPLPLAIPGAAGVAFGSRHGLGTWQNLDFAAQYPACVYPCQRFGHGLATVST
jgi:hypothetical protein